MSFGNVQSADPDFQLYDHEIIAMEQGPLAWMKSKQGTSMELEDFRRAAVEKFHDTGFLVYLKVFDTTEKGVYAFEVEILGRVEKKEFDFDRQVHEVVGNLLELPDQAGGWIDTDAALRQAEADAKARKHRH